MTIQPEKLMQMQAEALEASRQAATKTLEGWQKLAQLNLQTARASRPFRVERLESTRDLSPSARAWLETVSSGMLAQNNI